MELPADAQAAKMRVVGDPVLHPVAVRNISVRGLMAISENVCEPGTIVEIEVPGVGWVEGSVAWVQSDRFGVAFSTAVDPSLIPGE